MAKEITNLNIINAYKALTSLENKSFDGEISYAIYEIISKLKPKFEVLEKTKNSLIMKYTKDNGEKDGEKEISIKPGHKNWSAFIADLENIYTKKVILDFEPYLFKKEDFNLKQNKDIQPFVWNALEWLMVQEENPKKEDSKKDKKLNENKS